MLLPILMEIPYNQLGGIHFLTAILMDAVRIATNHGGYVFVCPICLPLKGAITWRLMQGVVTRDSIFGAE
jgi:hypothetical protein